MTRIPQIWITPSEVAQQLKLEEHVVAGLVRRGQLDATRFGEEWRIPDSALERYVARHSNAGRRRRPYVSLLIAAAALAGVVLVAPFAVQLVRAQSAAASPGATFAYQGYLEQGSRPLDGVEVRATFGLEREDGTPLSWRVEIQYGH